MAEYIERKQALNVLNLAEFAFDDKNKLVLYADSVDMCLLDIPSADVRPVEHGHWIVQRGNYNEEFECSVCRHISKDGGNYCSNCGARIDKE